jgi:hypothetical protein
MSITLRTRGDTGNTTAVTLNFKTLDRDTSSSKMKVGTGSAIPVYIKFGYDQTIAVSGNIFSSTDYAKMAAWNGDIILDCTVSTYPEIVVSTTPGATPTLNLLIVDKIKLSRKGGYLDRWDYTITFIQGDLTKLKRWT